MDGDGETTATWPNMLGALRAGLAEFEVFEERPETRGVYVAGSDRKPRLVNLEPSLDRLALATFVAIHVPHVLLALSRGATRIDVTADGIGWVHAPPLAAPV